MVHFRIFCRCSPGAHRLSRIAAIVGNPAYLRFCCVGQRTRSTTTGTPSTHNPSGFRRFPSKPTWLQKHPLSLQCDPSPAGHTEHIIVCIEQQPVEGSAPLSQRSSVSILTSALGLGLALRPLQPQLGSPLQPLQPQRQRTRLAQPAAPQQGAGMLPRALPTHPNPPMCPSSPTPTLSQSEPCSWREGDEMRATVMMVLQVAPHTSLWAAQQHRKKRLGRELG
jgi:hypothetical protein